MCFTVCQRRRRAVMKEKSFVKSVTAKHVSSILVFWPCVLSCLVFTTDDILRPRFGTLLVRITKCLINDTLALNCSYTCISWFNGSLTAETISEMPKKNTNRFKCICRQVLLLFSCCNNNKTILVDFAIRTLPLLSCKTPLSPAGGPFNIIMDSSTLRFIFASVRQSLNPKTSVKRHILQMHKNCTNTVERCA